MATNQPIASGATTTTVSRGISGMRIRSPLALLAALTFLVGIPISFGWQILFGSGAGTNDSLRPRRRHLTAWLLCFRFRATKMDELDRMRGCARLGHHISIA